MAVHVDEAGSDHEPAAIQPRHRVTLGAVADSCDTICNNTNIRCKWNGASAVDDQSILKHRIEHMSSFVVVAGMACSAHKERTVCASDGAGTRLQRSLSRSLS